MKRSALLLIGALAALVGALAFKGHLDQPPPVSAPAPGGFDANRAVARLARILGDERPHPVDTAANDAVRDRLLAELRGIGLAPRVTDDWACGGGKGGRFAGCARVRNVVATLGNAAAPGHVLLASHYDSTAAGPGAADDGIGVATMLEIAADLRGRKLARPVTFLFDEGEEAGLLGAKAFLEHDPLAAHLESVVNFEARGVTGPATMFETSRPNGPAVAAFAATSRRPVANSMTADFYRLIPNSTDVTVFAARPWTILNFAVIGNETRYHSPGDTVAALDRRSVQHMGSQGLAAALHLADKGAPAAGERIYADIGGRMLLALPKTFGLALFAAILIGTAIVGWTRREGLGRGIAAVLGSLVFSAAVVFAAQWAVGIGRPGPFWRAHPEVLALAVDLAALAVSAGVLASVAPALPRRTLRAAFWLAFMLLSLVIAWVAPGAAIFSILPPLVFLIGAIAAPRSARAEAVAAVLAWAVLFVTWAPLVSLSEVLLDFGAAWMFAPFAALIVLPALIELKPLAEESGRRFAVGGLAGAALAVWIAVAAAPAYSADRKQGFRIEYGWDAEAGRGQWLIANSGVPLPDGFPSRGVFRPAVKIGWMAGTRWAAPAPAVPMSPPTLQKLGERPVAGGRAIAARVALNGAEDLLLRFDPASGLKRVSIGGSAVAFPTAASKDPYYIRCTGRSCDGAVLDLVAGTKPLEGTAVGVRSGLPRAATPLVRARPATAQPQYSPDQTLTWAPVRL